MYHTFSILFFLQKNKATLDGKAPIYARITVNGKRAQISIQRKVLLEKWDSTTAKLKGTSAESRTINSYIDSIRHKLQKLQERFIDEGKTVTALAY